VSTAPRIRKAKESRGVTENGRLTVKFDQSMLFGKEFMDEINRSNRSLRQKNAPLTIIYKPGYMRDDENYHKNVLSKWEIVDVKEKELFIQLTFSKPVYVAAGDFRCTLEVSFGDGKKFLSAGLS
jgi:hypothetical protein